MSWKDRLQNAQGTKDAAPKLGVIMHLEIKKNENRDNEPGFSYSKKNESTGDWETKFIHKPISGIYLGHSMRLTIFDDDLGKSGGTYKSDYYWDSKNVKLFNPISRKVEVSGDMEEINKFAAKCTGNPSKKQVIFLLTKQGIITVTTNLSIAIDQLGNISRDDKVGKLLVLSPSILNDDSAVSNKAKGYLGKFIKKNPPLFADIKTGSEITDEDANIYRIEHYIDVFTTWLEYKQGVRETPGVIDGANPSSYNPHEINRLDDDTDADNGEPFTSKQAPADVPSPEEEEDDLPF